MKKTYKQMINTFKHGEYFYKFNGKVNGGYCWWKCDIADFDMHITDLKCIDFVIMDRQDFTRKQLLAEFDLKQAWRDELMSKKTYEVVKWEDLTDLRKCKFSLIIYKDKDFSYMSARISLKKSGNVVFFKQVSENLLVEFTLNNLNENIEALEQLQKIWEHLEEPF
jgi:hypothetical protein